MLTRYYEPLLRRVRNRHSSPTRERHAIKVKGGAEALVLRDSNAKISRINAWVGVGEGVSKVVVGVVPNNAMVTRVVYTINGQFSGVDIVIADQYV